MFRRFGSTDIDAAVSLNHDGFTKVEIMLGGDSEQDSMIDALRWAADNLEELKIAIRIVCIDVLYKNIFI